MENTKLKRSEEALAEIYRNAALALQSISNILPETVDEKLREEIVAQHEEYEKISARAATLARDKGIAIKEPSPFKKVMMWGSIKMNTLTDNSRAHIADMMIQGTVMGITALRKTASELPVDGNDAVLALLDEMIKVEEDLEKKWKEFLKHSWPAESW